MFFLSLSARAYSLRTKSAGGNDCWCAAFQRDKAAHLDSWDRCRQGTCPCIPWSTLR
jgi:hypothetical protein